MEETKMIEKAFSFLQNSQNTIHQEGRFILSICIILCRCQFILIYKGQSFLAENHKAPMQSFCLVYTGGEEGCVCASAWWVTGGGTGGDLAPAVRCNNKDPRQNSLNHMHNGSMVQETFELDVRKKFLPKVCVCVCVNICMFGGDF